MEAALAHTVRNKAEAAYARSDLFEKRRALMDEVDPVSGACGRPGSGASTSTRSSPSGSAGGSPPEH